MAKISTSDLIGVVTSEGLGYAVSDYCSAANVEDPQIAALWKTAADALRALDGALERAATQLGVEYE